MIFVPGCSSKEQLCHEPVTTSETEAQADLEADRPRYFYTGQPLSANSKLASILKQDYGLELVQLCCVPVPSAGEHANGYNKVVLKAINQHLGKDVIMSAWQKDQEQRERSDNNQ